MPTNLTSVAAESADAPGPPSLDALPAQRRKRAADDAAQRRKRAADDAAQRSKRGAEEAAWCRKRSGQASGARIRSNVALRHGSVISRPSGAVPGSWCSNVASSELRTPKTASVSRYRSLSSKTCVMRVW
jgi:hypothetical protein